VRSILQEQGPTKADAQPACTREGTPVKSLIQPQPNAQATPLADGTATTPCANER
jgi:hypothetical protein